MSTFNISINLYSVYVGLLMSPDKSSYGICIIFTQSAETAAVSADWVNINTYTIAFQN